MASKPALVFVPGAWHSPETWDKVSALLEAQEYKCVRPALPSTAGNASATFKDDSQAVRNPILEETLKGRDVIVVVHSYGGLVGSSAIKDLTLPKEGFTPSTDQGHVVGLIMMATGFAKTGFSFIDGLGGKPPPSWKIDPSGFAEITVDTRELFYHDLPVEEGNYWVSKLKKQSLKPLMEGGEDVYACWTEVPVWYLATTEDKALPIEAQRYFVQGAKDGGADVTIREVASSHSCMLSKPKETADLIVDAVAYFTKR
jgi:pimeloyl-ACP methyl ester carboxylesterase